MDKGDEDDGKLVKCLGIEKFKKLCKGLVIIVVVFFLLVVGVFVYYILLIICVMFSGDDKFVSNVVFIGLVKCVIGFSDDVDLFNIREELVKMEEWKESSGKVEMLLEKV